MGKIRLTVQQVVKKANHSSSNLTASNGIGLLSRLAKFSALIICNLQSLLINGRYNIFLGGLTYTKTGLINYEISARTAKL